MREKPLICRAGLARVEGPLQDCTLFEETTKPIYILIQSAYRKANENAGWNRCRRDHH
ncbi:MAG TPA: hypothetical protein PLY52_01820 [Methanothrix sp.]|uniref:hypothetical protein n=1 Tax=Methanothrix sp. TaxID=90426 RepID=UPI002B5BF25C|nr:hypothetical protein [Methanothrix sp.]MDI9416571.1 hypothetical protein [Euryarchaeota archaeon]HON35031.1 hypothetical protein [Methanothrix sp.]HRU74902.1 hypothetical protein [Methanothrix sp.]